MFQIKKAVRTQRPFKGCFAGVSGSGKTLSSLLIARGLVGASGKIVVIDSENESASLYADAKELGIDFEFDTLQLTDKSTDTYIKAIDYCRDFDCIIIDSASHAWNETLEVKAKLDLRGGNGFQNWNKINPDWNRFVNCLVACKTNLIVTLRSKADYILELNDKGKQAPRKVGLAPIFRDGVEYEFDVYGFMDLDNNLIIEKTRIPFLSQQIIKKPSVSLGEKISNWIHSGRKAPEPEVHLYDFSSIEDAKKNWVIENLPSKYQAKEIKPLVYSSAVSLGAKFEQFRVLKLVEDKPVLSEDDIFGLTSGNVFDSEAVNELQGQEH